MSTKGRKKREGRGGEGAVHGSLSSFIRSSAAAGGEEGEKEKKKKGGKREEEKSLACPARIPGFGNTPGKGEKGLTSTAPCINSCLGMKGKKKRGEGCVTPVILLDWSATKEKEKREEKSVPDSVVLVVRPGTLRRKEGKGEGKKRRMEEGKGEKQTFF